MYFARRVKGVKDPFEHREFEIRIETSRERSANENRRVSHSGNRVVLWITETARSVGSMGGAVEPVAQTLSSFLYIPVSCCRVSMLYLRGQATFLCTVGGDQEGTRGILPLPLSNRRKRRSGGPEWAKIVQGSWTNRVNEHKWAKFDKRMAIINIFHICLASIWVFRRNFAFPVDASKFCLQNGQKRLVFH